MYGDSFQLALGVSKPHRKDAGDLGHDLWSAVGQGQQHRPVNYQQFTVGHRYYRRRSRPGVEDCQLTEYGAGRQGGHADDSSARLHGRSQ